MTRPTPSPAAELDEIRLALKQLQLTTIVTCLDREIDLALRENQSPQHLLRRLLVLELNARAERRVTRRIRESRLPERKTLDDFDFNFQTGIDQRQIMTLASLGFVDRGQSLILAGHSGTGKSHIAKALMLLACQRNVRCRYVTAAEMLTDLKSGLVDQSLESKLKTYVNPELLCIDELGFDRLEQDGTRQASLFFKVIDRRYAKRSTILTSNMDFKDLGTYLGDPVMTAAMVDRLIHHAIIIRVEGPSWRMFQSKILNQIEDPAPSRS